MDDHPSKQPRRQDTYLIWSKANMLKIEFEEFKINW